MIAYHILCHANMAQVARQIESLYSPDDVFLIDIDDGNPVDAKPLETWLKKPNVHIKWDANIAWGGSGTLRKTMNGAFLLLDLDANWDYYVVLSGQCLPIKSNAHIRQTFSALNEEQKNSIRYVAHPNIDMADIPILNTRQDIKPWGNRGHTRLYALPGTIDPQFTMAARWRLEIVELGHSSQVFLRPCNEILMRRREEFFSQYQFCAGANWFNLHRGLLEHMRKDPFAYELYEVLSTTLIPDESFFQTYIYNTSFRDSVDKDHLRLIARPEPHLGVNAFRMKDWDAIANTNALYARKFDSKADNAIINKVLKHCESGMPQLRSA